MDRKERMPGEDAMEIARTVKEKYGYVCKDLVKEFKKFDEKKKADDGNWYLSNKFKKYIHKPSSGGNPIEIDVGYERFLGPEMFFHPVSKLICIFGSNVYLKYIGILPLRLQHST